MFRIPCRMQGQDPVPELSRLEMLLLVQRAVLPQEQSVPLSERLPPQARMYPQWTHRLESQQAIPPLKP